MERHIQNVIDGKYKDFAKDDIPDSFVSESKDKDADEGDDASEIEKQSVEENDNQVSEASTDNNVAPLSSSDGQVNSENVVDVQNVESKTDSVVRGSDPQAVSDIVTRESGENGVARPLSVDKRVGEMSQKGDTCETVKSTGGDKDSSDDDSVELVVESAVEKSEPPSIEQIKSELCASMSLEERVLRCPMLTPEWIMTGVSWEDVRQIYRRGAWIHCPNKPNLLMQWAEFEEIQGKKSFPYQLATTYYSRNQAWIW